MPQRTCGVSGCLKPHRARGLCSTHYNVQFQPNRHAASATKCTACGKAVLRPKRADRRPVCSVACRSALSGHDGSSTGYNWARDAARRAREAGASVVELFNREMVFERDGWICQGCRIKVSLDVDALDPSSATVDHIVPLSLGGVHAPINAQCLCLRCNSAKQDRRVATRSDEGWGGDPEDSQVPGPTGR